MKELEQDYIIWWEDNMEGGLDIVLKEFKHLFSLSDIPSIFIPLLYKFKKNSQVKNWDREIYRFSKNKIKEIESALGEERTLSILLENMSIIISIYENIIDLEKRIDLMNKYNGSEQDKAKIFSVSIFNDLLNKAFSNSLKLYIEFYSEIEGKNLYQKNLGPQIECLSSPKRGFGTFTNLASEPGIRNAMSHDGVRYKGTEILFLYNRGQEKFQEQKSIYDFKKNMLDLFDGTSAALLSWIAYLCERNCSYEELKANIQQKDASVFIEKLNFSTMTINCTKIEEVNIHDETEIKKQINMEFENPEIEMNSKLFFGINSAKKIFIDRHLSDLDSVMITFNSPKTLISFFRVQGSVLKALHKEEKTWEETVKSIIKSGDLIMFSENREERNESSDTFRFYPDLESDDYFVTEIEDISLEDQKRFKSVVYLKRAKRRNHVKEVVKSVINELKSIENHGFVSNSVKHGKMDADILYLPVYKKELPRGGGRPLIPENDNFVVLVQYDVNKKFPITNNFIDGDLKKRIEGPVEYKWNPNF
ncbi:hypothetical protein [Candidatus Enterococcus ferrettii]|uniref:Uncharacterized protein n=1 Tax=Candidatus Enterococcus ferrettii TaxID=2815324 RepID=A0ABV0EW71_9ENTE|nr:hypothetical protein [Enterococcus sp. 665A]MBO1340215.1 hypothetical protein [Enterococcus sp. 665A]